MFFFVFCKQKTAYEMRISDWSSDVCSSDLAIERLVTAGRQLQRHIKTRQSGKAQAGDTHQRPRRPCFEQYGRKRDLQRVEEHERVACTAAEVQQQCQRGDVARKAEHQIERESVVEGKGW